MLRMDSVHYRVFYGFLGRECKFAIMAKEAMEQTLRELSRVWDSSVDGGRVFNQFWYSVDAFLIATGNISKILWPPNPLNRHLQQEIEQRGTDLRNILGINSSSPFRESNRNLRNHFEHFDERIDEWFFTTARQPIVDSNIISTQIVQKFDPSQTFRNFDPNTWILYFSTDQLDFNEMISAVLDLQASLSSHLPS